ncbi:hypothetical protein STRIC_1481 [Streptococcus ictaluri 707-05]|uniref:Uncharacterized protein n=1 Tax=Streptococcus ictaluri 707-05 TaxID=764299 RepID=G5K3V7_9STRE|nr:hypothetical protein STRIC_1481 [Streptococcus ictaluri 707-05]
MVYFSFYCSYLFLVSNFIKLGFSFVRYLLTNQYAVFLGLLFEFDNNLLANK